VQLYPAVLELGPWTGHFFQQLGLLLSPVGLFFLLWIPALLLRTEKITLDATHLYLRHPGLFAERVYDLVHIRDLRLLSPSEALWTGHTVVPSLALAFRYGERTVLCAGAADPTLLPQLRDLLEDRLRERLAALQSEPADSPGDLDHA
jgi:hypothetical protein